MEFVVGSSEQIFKRLKQIGLTIIIIITTTVRRATELPTKAPPRQRQTFFPYQPNCSFKSQRICPQSLSRSVP
jgi:hypothetical protein